VGTNFSSHSIVQCKLFVLHRVASCTWNIKLNHLPTGYMAVAVMSGVY